MNNTPRMLITEADVIAAKLRAGRIATVHLNHKPDSAHHTDERDKCDDMACPCWNVCPADPADREAFDILGPFDELPDETASDDFREGLGEAYMTFYDSRCTDLLPEFSCDGLVAFMTRKLENFSERGRLGYIAGMLIAYGESNPSFAWESAEPPVKE